MKTNEKCPSRAVFLPGAFFFPRRLHFFPDVFIFFHPWGFDCQQASWAKYKRREEDEDDEGQAAVVLLTAVVWEQWAVEQVVKDLVKKEEEEVEEGESGDRTHGDVKVEGV